MSRTGDCFSDESMSPDDQRECVTAVSYALEEELERVTEERDRLLRERTDPLAGIPGDVIDALRAGAQDACESAAFSSGRLPISKTLHCDTGVEVLDEVLEAAQEHGYTLAPITPALPDVSREELAGTLCEIHHRLVWSDDYDPEWCAAGVVAEDAPLQRAVDALLATWRVVRRD